MMRTKKRWVNTDVSRTLRNVNEDEKHLRSSSRSDWRRDGAAAVMEERRAPVWARQDSSWFTKHFPAVPWCNRGAGAGAGGGSRTEEEDECVTWCRALTVVHYVAPGRFEVANKHLKEKYCRRASTPLHGHLRDEAGLNGRHDFRTKHTIHPLEDTSKKRQIRCLLDIFLISDVISSRQHHRSDWQLNSHPVSLTHSDMFNKPGTAEVFLRSAASPSSSSVVAGTLYPVPRPNMYSTEGSRGVVGMEPVLSCDELSGRRLCASNPAIPLKSDLIRRSPA